MAQQRSWVGRTGALMIGLLYSTAGTAHVDYVLEGKKSLTTQELLSSIIADPANLMLLILVPIAAGGVLYTVRKTGILKNDIDAMRRALAADVSYLPLLLRFSIGIPLIGAGFTGYLFSPVVHVQMRLILVTIGFFILFGLATRFMAAMGLLLYLIKLPVHPQILLAFEFVPGFLAIILIGSGKPSADHVLATLSADDTTIYSRIDPVYHRLMEPFRARVDPYLSYLPLILRAGLGIAFLYLGIAEKLLEPGEAIAVVYKYGLTSFVPVSPEMWVVGAALTEITIGIVLLLGLYTRLAAGTAFFMFTLTLFGLPDDPVLAHTSLFGLVAVLLIAGSGPYSLDAWLHGPGKTAEALQHIYQDNDTG
ncbi:MAG: DoxX family protein [Candidatus Nanohaloarchaea archaeon]|nr:DoxX family protein [Candidatus Nanohaloarchaea archaeon]